VPANPSDALEVLRASTPARLFAFGQLVSTRPWEPLRVHAEAVGAPGKEAELIRDPRVARVLLAMTAENRDWARDVRLQAIRTAAIMLSYDPAEITDDQGFPRRLRDVPPELRMCMESFELNPDGSIKKVKLVRRLDVVRLLMVFFGDIEERTVALGGHATVVFDRPPLEDA
jgi:hypothetical protein